MSNNSIQPPIHAGNGPPGYCPRCQEMMSFDGFLQLVSEQGFEHLPRQECEVSAKGGCPLCSFFCDLGPLSGRFFFETENHSWRDGSQPLMLFLSRGIEDPFPMLTGKPGDLPTLAPDSPEARSYLVGKPKFDEAIVVYAPVFTTESDPASWFIMSRPPLGYADESKVFATARSWIEDCRCNHAETCPLNTNVALPSRLIDVGDNMIAPDVRLRVTEQGDTGEYTALSYCWGGPQPVTLTLGNLDSMRQIIPLKDLPRTLQDAVRLTRGIGQRYLWVDALCIIQDSDEDKQREIQRMDLIYKNAVITMSAAAASAVSQGFLNRQPEPLPTLKWQLDVPDVGTHTIFISTLLDMYWPDDPLDRRGWVLQESYLSPRLLILSKQEPIWHCLAARLMTPKGSYLEYAIFRKRFPIRWPSDLEKPGHLLWGELVQHFTQRLLTNKEDRLNALAGIAADLQRLWEDDYIYGLWKHCFVELLVWLTVPPASLSSGGRSSRAPTWSWASLNSPIFFHHSDQILATVKITSTMNGFPHVLLTCRTKNVEAVTEEGLKCEWDFAEYASSSFPGAILMLVGKFHHEYDNGIDAQGIIGIPAGQLTGRFHRIGSFVMSFLSEESWRASWEAIEPEQIILE
ncbi:HET-domain-containing protein [Parathielavia appendiculata]|uniref:HET-domain-containing protein n=1 Tax=Parathielavia appendiculata TaxID=2587402 RepID=A0AAN6TZL3_9PEZI|nr:HET-domain-containing protein [Parathielavia appendiculata]